MADNTPTQYPYVERLGDAELRRYLDAQTNNGLYIQGARASGKTLMLQRALMAYPDRAVVYVQQAEWDTMRLPNSGDERETMRAVVIALLRRISGALGVDWQTVEPHTRRPLAPEALFLQLYAGMFDAVQRPLILFLDAYEQLGTRVSTQVQARLVHVWRTLVDDRGASPLRRCRLVITGRSEPINLAAAGSAFNPNPPIILGGLTDHADRGNEPLLGVRALVRQFPTLAGPDESMLISWAHWLGERPDLWMHFLGAMRDGRLPRWPPPDDPARSIFTAILERLQSEIIVGRGELIQETLLQIDRGDTRRFDRQAARLLAELGIVRQHHGVWSFTCELYRRAFVRGGR